MRGLFLKIFLLFWLSSAVLIGLFFIVYVTFNDDDHDHHLAQVYSLAEKAASTYRSDGRAALDELLRRAQRDTGVRGFLLDEDGRPLGRPPPRHLLRLIDRFPSVKRLTPPNRPRTVVHAVEFDLGEEEYRFIAVSPSDGRWSGFSDRRGFGLLGLILASFVASIVIAWVLTRPLSKLTELTGQFADGKLGVRPSAVLERRRDAIGELAREFARMASRIENLVSAQRQLVRDVSHEIRSPLARIQVAAALIRKKEDPVLDIHAKRIEDEVSRLDELVTGLLVIEEVDQSSGRQFESLDVVGLLDSVIDDARYEFNDRNIEFDLHKDGGVEPVFVLGDRQRLSGAIENIVRNAARYSPVGDSVSISVNSNDSSVAIQIMDRGPGVPEEYLARIFEPFFRADSSRSRDTGNHGIGLAIARAVFESHGGSVGAENRAGGGLSIKISLPLNRP